MRTQPPTGQPHQPPPRKPPRRRYIVTYRTIQFRSFRVYSAPNAAAARAKGEAIHGCIEVTNVKEVSEP